MAERPIETGVPLPRLGRGGRRPIYPFRDMRPGDSFFDPGPADHKHQNRLAADQKADNQK